MDMNHPKHMKGAMRFLEDALPSRTGHVGRGVLDLKGSRVATMLAALVASELGRDGIQRRASGSHTEAP
jgi:hypothetical protein